MAAREYPNIIHVFFVLPPVWIEVERGRVRHVTTGFIGNDGDIITYLALVRVAFKRIKRIAHRHVR